jgi:hypothetical protein
VAVGCNFCQFQGQQKTDQQEALLLLLLGIDLKSLFISEYKSLLDDPTVIKKSS